MPLEPKDGMLLVCAEKWQPVSLYWSEVDDPSGIAGYFLQLEGMTFHPRIPTPTPVYVGPLEEPAFEIPLECRPYRINYRWRVRAADRAGNSGPWSPWMTFKLWPPTPTPPPTPSPTPTPTQSLASTPYVLFDFVAEAAEAEWRSEAGVLPFPGKNTDERGFALWREDVPLEDGSRAAWVLETHPQWVDDGWIEGTYYQTENLVIKSGDRFVARVGFLQGAQAGDVTFGVYFRPKCAVYEFPPIIGQLPDTYDGRVWDWDVPLDEFAGQSGCFVLRVNAGETSAQDWAVWVEARIVRPSEK